MSAVTDRAFGLLIDRIADWVVDGGHCNVCPLYPEECRCFDHLSCREAIREVFTLEAEMDMAYCDTHDIPDCVPHLEATIACMAEAIVHSTHLSCIDCPLLPTECDHFCTPDYRRCISTIIAAFKNRVKEIV